MQASTELLIEYDYKTVSVAIRMTEDKVVYFYMNIIFSLPTLVVFTHFLQRLHFHCHGD